MAADPRIGTELAGYRIEEMVGRGGMGVVYRAEQLRLGRKVALKLLAPELSASEVFRTRFERESRAAAAIEHPNIIPLHEAGEADGLLFISMRYVEGSDLRGLLEREGPLDPETAVSIVAQVASALDAAHARGLVHRDVKPANVLVASGAGPESSDHCYLTDFGLTKDSSSASRGLTATGQFVGTLDYVAPEQIEGKPLDGRTDIYALGCVLYECLAGGPPFEKESDVALLFAHLNDPPPALSIRRPDLPAGLDAVIARALAKDPAERYARCADMIVAARAALRRTEPAATRLGPPPPARTVLAGPPPDETLAAADAPTARVEHPSRVLTPPTRLTPSTRRRRRAAAAGIGALAVGGIVTAAIVLPGGGEEPRRDSTRPDGREPPRARGLPASRGYSSAEVIDHFRASTGERLELQRAASTEGQQLLNFGALDLTTPRARRLQARFGAFNIFITRGGNGPFDTLLRDASGRRLKPNREGIYWEEDTAVGVFTANKLYGRNVVLAWAAGTVRRTDDAFDRLDRVLSALPR